MKKFAAGIFVLFTVLILLGMAALYSRWEEKTVVQTGRAQRTAEPVQDECREWSMGAECGTSALPTAEKQKISVQEIRTQRISEECIQISWSCEADAGAAEYVVKKRSVFHGESSGDWKTVAVVKSGATEYKVEDVQNSSAPVQYEYKVEVSVSDAQRYEPEEGKHVLGSNVMICIDPGHYGGQNAAYGAHSYGYAEGDFTLDVALQLKKRLKESYGIDAYMTRETDTIMLGGYKDQELDQRHISLRGEYGALYDSNLFVSIHTNANGDNANGYGTWEQPTAINKTLVFMNTVARESDQAIRTANAVGVNLSKINYLLGLSTVMDFRTAADSREMREWTDTYNDSLNEMGTLVYRMDGDRDYYGVLRGAASAGIPGLIIEHGLHTIPEVRKAAREGLAEQWAKADVYGIAYGFGFVDQIEMGEEEKYE